MDYHQTFQTERSPGASSARSACCLLLVIVAGCMLTSCGTPSIKQREKNQARLLKQMDAEVHELRDPNERKKLLRTLAKLRRELEETHAALEVEHRKLERLRQENRRHRVSASFTVNAVEIPYFSPITKSDGLDLWVMPRDSHGDAVKVPGSLTVSLHRRGLLGIGTAGKKLCEWSVPMGKLKDKWAGQLYRGYHVLLAWPEGKCPDVAEAVLKLKFTTPDGKKYKTEKVIKLRVRSVHNSTNPDANRSEQAKEKE